MTLFIDVLGPTKFCSARNFYRSVCPGSYGVLTIAIMLCSSEEELRARTPNFAGSIPGMTYFFLFLCLGVILVQGTDLRIGIAGTVGTPPTCHFGMLCSCILRSHATCTEVLFVPWQKIVF